MRRGVLWVVISAAVMVSGSGLAAPELQPAPLDLSRRALPVEGVITNPDWVRKPTGNDIANYYPPIAQVVGVEGVATIHCSVVADGSLAACSVIAEAPKGLRFGEATLRLANLFKMKPMTVDGAPISGGAINIPVRFALPQSRSPEAAAQTAPTPPPSAKAVALARRVAAVTTEAFVIGARANADQLQASQAPLSHEEEIALDAFAQAIAADTGQMTDGLAVAYVKTYSETELAGLAAFFESSAGRAWISRSRELSSAIQTVSSKFYQSVADDSRTRFCQQTTCPPPRTAVAPNPARPALPLAK